MPDVRTGYSEMGLGRQPADSGLRGWDLPASYQALPRSTLPSSKSYSTRHPEAITPAGADAIQQMAHSILEPWVMGCILSVASCLIVSTNLLVAAALLQLVRRRGSQSWCFVLNLALADTLVGLAITGIATEDFNSSTNDTNASSTSSTECCTTVSSSHITGSPPSTSPSLVQGRTRCLIRMAFIASPCSASIMSMFLISLDRYVAIKLPLRYSQLSGKATMAGALMPLWFSSFTVGFLPVMVQQLQKDNYTGFCTFFSVIHPVGIIVVFCVCFFPVLSLFVYIYLDILKIACSHQKQILQVRPAAGTRGPQQQSSRYWGHVKALRTVAVLVGCFSLLWCPFFVVCMVEVLCENCKLTSVLENDLWLLGLCNSLINPVVYALWQKEVRLQLAAMFSFTKDRMMRPGPSDITQRCHPPPVQTPSVTSGGDPLQPVLLPQISSNDQTRKFSASGPCE